MNVHPLDRLGMDCVLATLEEDPGATVQDLMDATGWGLVPDGERR